MAYEFKLKKRVEFADTDAAGIMYFANFFTYMEQAEHAFLRPLGCSVHTKTADGFVGFPRVAVRCEYKQPLKFEDEVEVQLLVRVKKARMLVYDFVFHKLGGGAAAEAARGTMAVVCIEKREGDDELKSIAIPDDIAGKIETAPKQMLNPSGLAMQ